MLDFETIFLHSRSCQKNNLPHNKNRLGITHKSGYDAWAVLLA